MPDALTYALFAIGGILAGGLIVGATAYIKVGRLESQLSWYRSNTKEASR